MKSIQRAFASLAAYVTEYVVRTLETLFPRRCSICGCRLAPSAQVLCLNCELELNVTGFEAHSTSNAMHRALQTFMPVERAAALFYYNPNDNQRQLVLDLKYRHRQDIGLIMGERLAKRCLPHGFFEGIDFLVPMPLTKKRLRQRGYNQSLALAMGISAVTGIPIAQQAVIRRHFAGSQTQLHNTPERLKNVQHAFAPGNLSLIANKHLLIIDDVVTTGASVSACANILLQADNVRLSVLSLAFTR